MAKINAINNESQELTIDPGASGDSFIQFSINGTGEFRIGVDDTDDSFRISQGSALGTSDTFIMTAAGERTMSLQPAFSSQINAEANVSGDDTDHAIGSVTSDTQIFDQGGDFVVGNGSGTGATFTAPITAIYLFTYTLRYNIDSGSGGQETEMSIITSNRTYSTNRIPTRIRVTNFYGASGYLGFSMSAIADMDASDTTTFVFDSRSGSKVDDIVDGFIGGALLV